MNKIKQLDPISDLARYLLDLHYGLQKGCFFSDVVSFRGGRVASSRWIPTILWNHISIESNVFTLEELNAVIANAARLASSANFPFGVYIPEHKHFNAIKCQLLESGYTVIDQEAWMCLDCGQIPNFKNSKLSIEAINSSRMTEDFTRILSECFSGGYAQAVAYEQSNLAANSFTSRLHFVGYDETQPVCIGSLYWRDGVGIIHNMGSVLTRRNEGLGAAMLSYICAYGMKQLTLSQIWLQCDGGGDMERFYSNRHFRRSMLRLGMQRDTL